MGKFIVEQIVQGFVEMNKYLMLIAFSMFSFAGLSKEKIIIKGEFYYAPLNKLMSFNISHLAKKQYELLLIIDKKKKCVFKISSKTAPQQIRGRVGKIHSEATSNCYINEKEKIHLFDVYYKIDKEDRFFGKVQVTSNKQSYLFNFK